MRIRRVWDAGLQMRRNRAVRSQELLRIAAPNPTRRGLGIFVGGSDDDALTLRDRRLRNVRVVMTRLKATGCTQLVIETAYRRGNRERIDEVMAPAARCLHIAGGPQRWVRLLLERPRQLQFEEVIEGGTLARHDAGLPRTHQHDEDV